MLGATGFVGSGVVAYGRAAGIEMAAVTMPRVDEPADLTAIDAAADRWQRAHRGPFADLAGALAPFDVVINAAGAAHAGAAAAPRLMAANAVLPAIVAAAAHQGGVRRLVHVSTAAVQGRLDPLDESPVHRPLSPYATSKAAGERVLFARAGPGAGGPPELVVYRPTSVQAAGHGATAAFARLIRALPVVPVAGAGDQPVPVAQLDNVAAGIVFAATMAEPVPIVLQPAEDMTVRRLVELFGGRRVVAVPPRATSRILDQAGRLTRRSAYLTSRLRWFELLLRGQAVAATALAGAGFTLPAGWAGWEALARATPPPIC